MFLNDVSLRFRWSERCCYPSCFCRRSRPGRSRLTAPGAHDQIGVIWRSEAFIAITGTKGHNHTVRPLAPPYSAVYGVWLASSRGVPVVWGGSRPGRSRLPVWCGVVGSPLQWGGVDGGYSPTIGVPLWWGAPYSGDGWIVGASPLLGFPDCGC